MKWTYDEHYDTHVSEPVNGWTYSVSKWDDGHWKLMIHDTKEVEYNSRWLASYPTLEQAKSAVEVFAKMEGG